ncbi:MAG TPA: hypothetical protein PKO12_07435 [Holophaga sp.]|nr:hypothetical protein [Holophaga sp.]
MLEKLLQFLQATGFSAFAWENVVMIIVACVILYLAIVKEFEPLLLIPSVSAPCWPTSRCPIPCIR